MISEAIAWAASVCKPAAARPGCCFPTRGCERRRPSRRFPRGFDTQGFVAVFILGFAAVNARAALSISAEKPVSTSIVAGQTGVDRGAATVTVPASEAEWVWGERDVFQRLSARGPSMAAASMVRGASSISAVSPGKSATSATRARVNPNAVSNKRRDVTPPEISGSKTPLVVENSTLVATYTANESVTWSLSGGVDVARFVMNGGVLRFATAPDFEAPTDFGCDNRYGVAIRATDTAGNVTYKSITVTVTDADEIPPVISGPTEPSVVENTTAIATYTVNEAVTWSINGGVDAARFRLSGGALSFKAAPNFEAPRDSNRNNRYGVTIRAVDAAGNVTYQPITVTVTDADEIPPVIAGAIAPSVVENSTAVATYTANEAVTWSLNGGDDADRFTLDGGALAFVSAPDFEVPSDANTDNSYLVVVRATDTAGNTADQSITVTVTDVDEVAPVISGSVELSVVETITVSAGPGTQSVVETAIGIATYIANEPVVWSINSGVDADRFILTGGVLSFVSAPDFEAPADTDGNNTYLVVIRATDTADNTTDKSISVTVTDADEIAPVISGHKAPSVDDT